MYGNADDLLYPLSVYYTPNIPNLGQVSD